MSNLEFELAEQFALYTHKHCFVSGRAGTGKTTLLRKLVHGAQKNIVVVAPTGVAAVNAAGVTIHSMFGLPLTCFVPNDDPVDPNVATNRHRLLAEHLRLHTEKLHVLRELELLILDEISMVRCDVLDAVDLILRTVRGDRQPFGGVQTILIGDIHQLPPVAKETEWTVLRNYYRSPFFFDSLVWPRLGAAHIELQTVYRQRDARFLSLLESIRRRRLEPDDYRLLQERYDPHFKPQEPGFVLLSTHNHKADSVNASELAALPDQTHAFAAEIDGEFPAPLFPCERVLHLKVGAQVMFVRNDTEAGAYYNGKLATVKQIRGDVVTVTFRDSGADYTVHRETWENAGYGVEEESGKVERRVLGTFSQYPLRLAWAITIHKSQGLTLDKVIVDAGRSFAAGQVYVALSRCRSLDGIVLHSLITPDALREDCRIEAFSASRHAAGELHDLLAREKAEYAGHLLQRLFTFRRLSVSVGEWRESIERNRSTPDPQRAAALQDSVRERLAEIEATAEKFRRQLRRMSHEAGGTAACLPALKERCGKAIEYFTERIATQLAAPLREHIASVRGAKKRKKSLRRYIAHVQLIEQACWDEIGSLYEGRLLDERLYGGVPRYVRDQHERPAREDGPGGATIQQTLGLHRQHKTAEEIATLRGLTLGTIKSHLAQLIERGEIDVHEILSANAIDAVVAFLREHGNAALSAIRTGTGDHLNYDDIRMVAAHCSRVRTRTDE
ncbi:MAG: helix-turn-helix domain-containing protein [Steroidobacteraceae bacterium]